jgi:hypothetical protein
MKQKIPKPKKFQQNHDVTVHYHPRRLARAIAHSKMEEKGATGVNKVRANRTKSAFAKNWRAIAQKFAQ